MPRPSCIDPQTSCRMGETHWPRPAGFKPNAISSMGIPLASAMGLGDTLRILDPGRPKTSTLGHLRPRHAPNQ
jgi:hypothetical protein